MTGALVRTAHRTVDAALGRRLRVVRVLSGVARGARLELDLSREKAYWVGVYEPVVQDFLRTWVRPGDTVYDVGAHHGFVTVCAGRLGARVVAFEASPENAARVRRNAGLNRLDVEVVEAAVWDADGEVELTRGDFDAEWRAGAGGGTRSVRLDSLLGTLPPPRLLKIDVEGAEAHVLRGAERLLAEHRPVIVCELHGDDLRRQVIDLLPDHEVTELGGPWRLAAVARQLGSAR